MMGWRMHGFRGHGMFGFGGGGIMMILFWALIIIGVIYLFRRGTHHGGHHSNHRRPRHGHPRHNHPYDDSSNGNNRSLEILKERYAKGEIDKETYLEMKKDLEE
mgnify:CR=1 FL=1